MELAAAPREPRNVATDGAAAAVAEAFGPRPALTVYRSGGRRVELSGAVLGNWAEKTANLVTEELEPAPEDVLQARVLWGWRGPAFVLGAWAAGLRLGSESEGGSVHLLSELPDALRRHAEAGDRFAWTLALPVSDLARAYDGPAGESLDAVFPSGRIPTTAVDLGAALPGFGDWFNPMEPVSGEPLPAAGMWGGDGRAVVVRVPEAGAAAEMPQEHLTGLLAGLAGGTPAVLVADPEADLERIAAAHQGEVRELGTDA